MGSPTPEYRLTAFTIRPPSDDDREWVKGFIAEHWGSDVVVAHGVIYHPHELPGLVAIVGNKRVGLITFSLDSGSPNLGPACEVVTLNCTQPGQGIGTELLSAVAEIARQHRCTRLWLITTNDNLSALGFYQKRGMVLVRVHRNALDRSRLLKPEIPRMGANRIPIRDEIELEMALFPDLGQEN